MDAKRLEKYQRRLSGRLPLLGRWLRGRAVKALARDGSPEAARILARAATRISDPLLSQQLLNALRRLAVPACIDAVCAVWAATRHAGLTRLLLEQGWVAQAPVAVRVLSALKGKRGELLQDEGAEVVEPLLQACEDDDPAIADLAHECLKQMRQPEARDALCRIAVEEDHPAAQGFALAAGYVPSDPRQRCLYFFLNGQWRQYEQLDLNNRFLRRAYEEAEPPLRARIAEQARRAGRVEWVEVVAGGRLGLRLAAMTDEEWRDTLAVLAKRRRWEEMWRLAQQAPPRWGVRLLQCLADADWQPPPDDRAGYEELTRLAGQWNGDVPNHGTLFRCQATLRTKTGQLRCLAFGPDGRFLIAGGVAGILQQWTLPEGRMLGSWVAHSDTVTGLAVSPDGDAIASAGRDHKAHLWGLPEGALLRTFQGEGPLALSPDGWLLAGRNWESAVRLWSLPEGEAFQIVGGERAETACLAVSPDGRVLATAVADRIVLWSLPRKEVLQRLRQHTLPVTCLAVSPDGRILASGSRDSTIRLWRLPIGQALRTLRGHEEAVTSVAVSPDGRLLASGGEDRTVRLWQLPEGRPLRTLPGHTQAVTGLAFSPDGTLLASGGANPTVRLWVSELVRLCRVPASQSSLEDLTRATEALRNEETTVPEHRALEFIAALLRWRRRSDILVEGAATGIVEVGAFDIEIADEPK